MKEVAKWLSIDTMEFYAPLFYCDIDGGSDDLTGADQNVWTIPDAAYQPDFKSNQYQLPPPLSNRPSPDIYPPCSCEHSLACPKERGHDTRKDQWHLWTFRTKLANRLKLAGTNQNSTNNMQDIISDK